MPPPAPRPTVTYANCTVSAQRGFRPLHLDLHVPTVGIGPFPVVLWIHGGGYEWGSRVWMPDSVAPHGFHDRLLARGYAVADVDYRLAFESPYPSQLADVQSAIRWLRHFAADLNLDPARFAALGESAGGHLAAIAGLLGRDETALQAIVNWYGVMDFAKFLDDLADGEPDEGGSFLLGGLISERPDFVRWAAPLHQVHPAAPPFLNVHGTDDTQVPFSHSEDMTAALLAAGVRCDLLAVPGADHCFVGHDDIGGLIDASIDFLDSALIPSPAPTSSIAAAA